MSANLASLVNQQLYHCELLLAQIETLDKDSFSFRASKQALLNAAIHASFLGYQGFLQELAESCQIMSKPQDLEALVAALASESRSHASVANLQSLMEQGESWLVQLLKAEYSLFEQAPAAPSKANHQLIALSAIDQKLDLPEIQAMNQALKTFVSDQREFLQEW